MDAVALRRSAEAVEIESRNTQIGRRFGPVQDFQPAQATRMEARLDMATAASFEQFGKTLVPEAPDYGRW